jgi:hypothetical protein
LASYQLANLGTWLMWLFFSTSGHCFRSRNYFSLRLIGASEEKSRSLIANTWESRETAEGL